MPEPLETEDDIGQMLQRLWLTVVRRRWWILSAVCSVTFSTILVVSLLPDRFQSDATLLVVQQQVPQRYVFPTTTASIADALEAMTHEILSRKRLLAMIEEVGLYEHEKKYLVPEELVSKILKNIDIEPLEKKQQDFNSFKISFSADAPRTAQRVTSTLVSLFIQENLKSREEQATTTTNFLHEQVEAKKKEMEQIEQRLREFKMKYLGELPEQQQGNLGILTGLQIQLQNTMTGINRAQQQRVYLESLLAGHLRQAAGMAVGAAPSARVASPLERAIADLARLRSERAVLLGQYTPTHPAVKKADREIALAETMLESFGKGVPVATSAAGDSREPAQITRPQASTEEDTAIGQINSQLEANRFELENLAKDEARLKAAISEYQQRLNQTPVREEQLSGIIRDTELVRQAYADLQKKEQESQLSQNLEKNQRGQQFRLIDPPSLPTVPSSPKRVKISLVGAAAGLLLGLVVAFLVDMQDHSFHSEKELRNEFSPPVVIGIPVLFTPDEWRIRRWRKVFEWCLGSVLVLAVFAAELYVYRFGQGG
jgi:polysaccharide chain length determinant protein (PEP-CTERM system associated)